MITIKFTSAYDDSAESKIQIYRKLNALDSEFDFSTSLFDNLLIVFQLFPKNDPVRKVKEYKVMRRKTPTLELYLVLDYDKVIQGTDAENLAYMKEVLLKGCEKFLKPLKGFEWPAFETALRQHLF